MPATSESPAAAERDTLISADENRQMFNTIAERYDLMNLAMSQGLDRRWRRRAVRELAPVPEGEYLDIGAGTGDVSLEILRQCPTARVIGIDASEEMLAVGREKIAAANLSAAIELQTGDALALPYEAETFAGTVSAFTLRNLEDRALGLKEMRRVIKSGGRTVVLELTRPENSLIRCGHWFYNHTIVPLLGRLLSRGDAYTYLAKSIDDFPAASDILTKMTAAGFENVRAVPLQGGIVTIFIGGKI